MVIDAMTVHADGGRLRGSAQAEQGRAAKGEEFHSAIV
jgi:hypothetical protein